MNFTIYGNPIAKGRPKFSNIGGFVKAYTPEKTVNYENLVKLSYKEAGGEVMDGELSLQVVFYFPIPKSTSKKNRAKMVNGEILHTKRPDIDNCLKSLFDGLNGVAWNDDSSVSLVNASKKYAEEPRTEVWIDNVRH